MSQVDEASAQRELNAALERFRGDPRVALGLAPTDDVAAARRAFMALCKVYHPAKFARHDPPTVKLCNEVFLAIRRCYETLSAASPLAAGPTPPTAPPLTVPPPMGPPSRTPASGGMPILKAPHVTPAHERATTRMIRSSATPPGGVPLTPRVAPPRVSTPPATSPELVQFEKALELARAQRWADARAIFSDLSMQFPGDPRYRAYLHYARGWEAFGGGKRTEAKAEWQRSLACDPTNSLARWALESTGLAK